MSKILETILAIILFISGIIAIMSYVNGNVINSFDFSNYVDYLDNNLVPFPNIEIRDDTYVYQYVGNESGLIFDTLKLENFNTNTIYSYTDNDGKNLKEFFKYSPSSCFNDDCSNEAIIEINDYKRLKNDGILETKDYYITNKKIFSISENINYYTSLIVSVLFFPIKIIIWGFQNLYILFQGVIKI